MAKQYPNRSDLRNPAGKIAKQAATGQPYGEATKQMNAQSAVPMGAAPTDAVPQQAPAPMPGALGGLDRPTDRPNEPITAGADFGPGPNSNALIVPTAPAPGSNQDLAEQIRALTAMYPNPALMQLLMDLES